MPNRRLLAIFAYPDDETFLAGPLLARCAAAGVHVGLVCETLLGSTVANDAAARRRAEVE